MNIEKLIENVKKLKKERFNYTLEDQIISEIENLYNKWSKLDTEHAKIIVKHHKKTYMAKRDHTPLE